MPRRDRVCAAIAVALLCAPGTWLRTETQRLPVGTIAVTQLQGETTLDAPGWDLAGIWQYSAKGFMFGGYSALLVLEDGRLQAFSDRGQRLTFTQPERPAHPHHLALQRPEAGRTKALWDIESATPDPATGTYWLGYEQDHAIHRFTSAHRPDGVRDLRQEVSWPDNSGAEAMVRLADGRFVVLPEGQDEGLIFAGDPVESGPAAPFRIDSSEPGFVITGAKQLPDGRMLVLMRKVRLRLQGPWPPFASLLAIGDAPEADGRFAPIITLRFENAIPRENYEALAIRERKDGKLDIWVMSDDNLSAFQRTLLVKLVFDPAQ